MRILPKILRFRWRSVPVLPWPRVLLLGMLCLRALVPAGFMLGPVDGHVGMVLCEANAAGMPAHHHHPGMQHAPQHAGHDPTCPYAQSAGKGAGPALCAQGQVGSWPACCGACCMPG